MSGIKSVQYSRTFCSGYNLKRHINNIHQIETVVVGTPENMLGAPGGGEPQSVPGAPQRAPQCALGAPGGGAHQSVPGAPGGRAPRVPVLQPSQSDVLNLNTPLL